MGVRQTSAASEATPVRWRLAVGRDTVVFFLQHEGIRLVHLCVWGSGGLSTESYGESRLP